MDFRKNPSPTRMDFCDFGEYCGYLRSCKDTWDPSPTHYRAFRAKSCEADSRGGCNGKTVDGEHYGGLTTCVHAPADDNKVYWYDNYPGPVVDTSCFDGDPHTMAQCGS